MNERNSEDPTKRTGAYEREEYAVMLPCRPEDFKEFVSGLLGKPQTITKRFLGKYDISKEDVESFHHVLTQRVAQQNEGKLIQFTIKIIYDDNSSVLLNSLKDFIHYNEVRHVSSIAAHLTWTFLVLFPDRKVPEKQTIEISIITNTEKQMPFYDEDLPFFLMHSPKKGYITFQISHTARTWGGDIEALLSGHIKNLLQPVSKIRDYIREHDGLIALFVGLTFFLIALGASLYTTNIYMNNLLSNSQDIINLSGNDPQTLSDKLNHIINLSVSGAWPRYFLYNVCFLFIAAILSISFAVWAGSSADSKDPSFLILTKQSENKKKEITRKSQKSWISFCASIAVSIVCSIIGNIIFISIFGKITL